MIRSEASSRNGMSECNFTPIGGMPRRVIGVVPQAFWMCAKEQSGGPSSSNLYTKKPPTLSRASRPDDFALPR